MKVKIVLNKNLSLSEKRAINKARVSHWGEKNRKDFTKDYEPNTRWVFVKKDGKIVSLGGIRPIRVRYLGKNYNIGGICSTISIEKKKGYGRMMIKAMRDYSKKTGKSLLGFTGKQNLKIFKRTGLKTKVDFIKRFVWIKSSGEREYDDDGHGIYYDGKDHLLSRMLKGKKMAEIFVEFW